MKIDSSLYPKLKENLLQDEDLKDFVENNEFENAEKLLFEKNNNLNLDNISLSLGLDRKLRQKSCYFISLTSLKRFHQKDH